MKTGIKIVKAQYVTNYIIKLTFSDGKVNLVDFEKQVMAQKVPKYKTYQKIENFKKFEIEGGNIVWGKDWDLIFDLCKLYKNTLDSKAGRKTLPDKKLLLRLYIPKSIIEANGGQITAQEKCTKYLLAQA
jgi:hypothetical protein